MNSEYCPCPPRRPRATPGVIGGLIIIAIGVVALLNNFGVIHVRNYWDFWPLILVVAGVNHIVSSGHAPGRIWGGLLTTAGVYLLLYKFDYVPYSFWRIWPVFLIAVGVLLFWQAAQGRRDRPDDSMAPMLNEFVMFGGGKRTVGTQNFRGGEAFVMFGGDEIDLRKAGIEGERAWINASVIFGGIEIWVPETWSVSTEGVAIFGGYEDKTVQPKADAGTPTKRLVVRGFTMFGGVEVKN